MLKKVTTLGLSALFLGCGFGFVKAAPAPVPVNSSEKIDARIQNKRVFKYSSENVWANIFWVKNKIRENEEAIKILEKNETKLYEELARKMNKREFTSSFFERLKINRKIDMIISEIDLNEAKIKSLKDRRSDLDHELAFLLDMQEKNNVRSFMI